MRTTTRVSRAVVAAAAVVLVACRPEAGASPTDPASAVAAPDTATTSAPVDPMVPSTTTPPDPMHVSEPTVIAAPVGDGSATGTPVAGLAAIAQRCTDAAGVLDARIDAEDLEYPEEIELDEDELEEVMTPAPDFDDGVAGPEERPMIAPMPPFDPMTVPILELDLMIESCIENGIVTEAELFGPDDEEGGGDEDAEFCTELAALSAEEITEFAAEDGEEVVREEFASCELPDPIGS